MQCLKTRLSGCLFLHPAIELKSIPFMILFRFSFFAQGLRVALTALILSCTPSCSENHAIEAYPIEPEYEGPVVAWDLPENWAENPDLSGPMAGSFHIKTEEGPKGRIGVMPFRESVSILEVANMFAREIGYGILTERSLAPLLERKTLGDRVFEWVRMEERGGTGTGRSILLALFRQDSETWLFPFIAEKELVETELENFSAFLESTVLRPGKATIQARPPEPAPSPPPSPAELEGVPSWDVPSHWVTGKSSSMRLASHKVYDEEGNEIDFSITSFPGDVGGLLANVNRWLGQIGLPPTDQENLPKFVRPVEVAGLPAQLVEASSEDQALYAAILFKDDRSWFFKMTGSASLAAKEKEGFLHLLDSVSFPKP